MYIIRKKIRVICSNIRVGMEGGGPFFMGVYISQGNVVPRVHIPLLNMDPGSIFRGGSIFNMTPVVVWQRWAELMGAHDSHCLSVEHGR